MSSSTEEQDRRRRLPFVLLLVGLLLSGALAAGLEELRETRRPAPPERADSTASPPAPVIAHGPQQAAQEGDTSGELLAGVRGTTVGTAVGRTGAGASLPVEGVVDGDIAPGKATSLLATVRNPFGINLVITSLEARVVSVSSAGSSGTCLASWYRVGSFTGRRALPAGAIARLVLPVTFLDLQDVNQDACKGARYVFTYAVRARQA